MYYKDLCQTINPYVKSKISVRYIQSVLNGTHLVYPFGHHWQAIYVIQVSTYNLKRNLVRPSASLSELSVILQEESHIIGFFLSKQISTKNYRQIQYLYDTLRKYYKGTAMQTQILISLLSLSIKCLCLDVMIVFVRSAFGGIHENWFWSTSFTDLLSKGTTQMLFKSICQTIGLRRSKQILQA